MCAPATGPGPFWPEKWFGKDSLAVDVDEEVEETLPPLLLLELLWCGDDGGKMSTRPSSL